jgi:hypothetical protein
MKKKFMCVVCLAVLAPLLWLGSSASPNWADNNQALGQKLAGGWFADLMIGENPLAEVMFNLTDDGCIIINGQLLRDFPEAGHIGMNTTAHGTWKRTGPNEIEAFILLFEQDDNGKTVVYETGRSHLVLTEKGTQLDGTMDIQLIQASADPLNPSEDDIVWGTTLKVTARPIR